MLWQIGAVMVLFVALAACGKAADDPKNFVGVWINPDASSAQSENAFRIDDRILIESEDGLNFRVSILARGVFTDMRYIPDKGYICAESKACFGLQDADTLLVGSESGKTVSYKRSDEK